MTDVHQKHRGSIGLRIVSKLCVALSLWEVTSIFEAAAATRRSFHTQGCTSPKKLTLFEGRADVERGTRGGSAQSCHDVVLSLYVVEYSSRNIYQTV